MKIVNQNAVIMDQTTPDKAYEHIEKIGRTCYKSEDRITDGSAVKFCSMLKNSKHYAMLEHYMIHLKVSRKIADMAIRNLISCCYNNYIIIDKAFNAHDDRAIISGSFRAFLENGLHVPEIYVVLAKTFPEMFDEDINMEVHDDITIISDNELVELAKDIWHGGFSLDMVLQRHITHTVLFTTDRGVSHEMVRHRPASFAQESTRYCNYSKGKFDNEITVIKPCFYDENDEDSELYDLWKVGCEDDEINYFKLLAAGATAQQARDNLPTSVKTDLIVTATEYEWQHIIDLRYHGTTGAPHPQMKEVMSIAYPLLVEASNSRLK